MSLGGVRGTVSVSGSAQDSGTGGTAGAGGDRQQVGPEFPCTTLLYVRITAFAKGLTTHVLLTT